MTKKYTFFILFVIVLFGFLIKVYRLSDIPSGFFCDEASIGYNAYSVLHYGKDEYGKPLPFFFQAFGEYKNPIQIYSTVPFIAILGLNELSVRLPSVIFGTTAIIAIYFLTKELMPKWKNKRIVALIAALFLAISPWHTHFSRASFEGIMPFILFTTLGLYFFLRSQINIRALYLSVVAFALAIYSYFPARIFIPLLGLSMVVIYVKFILQNKRIVALNLLLLLFLLFPLIEITLSPLGFARWNQVNIFSQPPGKITIPQHIVKNYFSHFSPNFLFLKGDIDMPGQFITRHSVRGMGELYLFQLPLIIFGFIFLIRKRAWKPTIILFLWLILYPIGSMFTTDQNAQATRSIIGVVPFQIISAIGLYYLVRLFSKIRKSLAYISSFIMFIVIAISFVNYLNLYFVKYTLYSSDFWGWQYGPKEIIKYFVKVQISYDDLYLNGEFNGSEIFYKFYDPLNSCQNKCKMGSFYTSPQILNPKRKQLFALSPNALNESLLREKFLVKKTIYYPNNTIAFLIGEIVK